MKKEDIINELKQRGVEFDPAAKVEELKSILEASEPAEAAPAKPSEDDKALVEAKVKSGLSREQAIGVVKVQRLRDAQNKQRAKKNG